LENNKVIIKDLKNDIKRTREAAKDLETIVIKSMSELKKKIDEVDKLKEEIENLKTKAKNEESNKDLENEKENNENL
jgi:hypothetical protein